MSSRASYLATKSSSILTRKLPFWVEPAQVFEHIACLPGSMLLESQPGALYGRFSIICTSPFGTLRTIGRSSFLNMSGESLETNLSPFEILRDLLFRFQTEPNLLAGAIVGYFGYEMGGLIENLPEPQPDDIGMPDCFLGFYNHLAIFDHTEKAIFLNGCSLEGTPDPLPGIMALEQLIIDAQGEDNQHHLPREGESIIAPCSSFTLDEYCAVVNRCKEYIAAGDIYQVNISQRFKVPLTMSPWSMYLKLRSINPSPYAAYLNCGGFQVVCSSPECFLDYCPSTRIVITKPIKGTRPRGSTSSEDERLARELASSEKDMAENVMIVDLERNDLGRVCEFGSVDVPLLAQVESHSTVHHLVTTVRGRLRQGLGAVDLLMACFPSGSITGAPKIRSMEIISELEPVRRGVYTGSIGYLGFDGSVNLNVAIRTAITKGDLCYFHVGGGIVADSEPVAEYQETLDKGRAFMEVLGCLKSSSKNGAKFA